MPFELCKHTMELLWMEDQCICIWTNHQKEGKYWIKLFCPHLNLDFLIAIFKVTNSEKKNNFDSVHFSNANKCETFSNFSCLFENLYFNLFIISFSSSNTQFYESWIFCLFSFLSILLDKSFKLISKYTQKCQYNLLY